MPAPTLTRGQGGLAQHVYLCDIVGTGTEANPFVPAGIPPEAVPGWIDLRPDPSVATGYGIVAMTAPVLDARLRLFAGSHGEGLAVTSRVMMGNRLGLTLTQAGGPSVADMLAELLVDHARVDGTRWRPLTTAADGAKRIHLAGTQVWSQTGPSVPNSQTYIETWPGGDGTTLTTAAGRNYNWTETENSEVVSARVRPADTVLAAHRCVLDSILDTTNHYIEGDCAMTSRGSNVVQTRLEGRFGDANNNYHNNYRRDTTVQRALAKRVASSNTTLGSDTTDPGASFTSRLTCNGSTITMRHAGVDLFSVTDTSLSGQTQCAFFQLTSNTVGDATMGQVTIADVVSAVSGAFYYRYYHRMLVAA